MTVLARSHPGVSDEGDRPEYTDTAKEETSMSHPVTQDVRNDDVEEASWQSPGAIIVVGAIPGAGASSIAWSIATACGRLLGTDEGISVIDAAAPRRSVLRGMAHHSGAAMPVTATARLVPSRAGAATITYLEGQIDERVDELDLWPAQAGARIVDVGLSAEEALSHPSAGVWLRDTGARIVLVLPSNVSSQVRCEALLAAWSKQGWAPIDDVVLVGPNTDAVSGTYFMAEAMSTPLRVGYLPDLATRGLPEAETAIPAALAAWARIGETITADVFDLHVPASTSRRRWGRSR